MLFRILPAFGPRRNIYCRIGKNLTTGCFWAVFNSKSGNIEEVLPSCVCLFHSCKGESYSTDMRAAVGSEVQQAGRQRVRPGTAQAFFGLKSGEVAKPLQTTEAFGTPRTGHKARCKGCIEPRGTTGV